MTGKTITYSKSGDDIFTSFDETGKLSLNGTAGTATVTAKFAGDDTYNNSSASYTITVKEVITDIATLKSKVTATSSTKAQTFTLKLNNAMVTYKNGDNVYLEDATGGLYCSVSGGITTSDGTKLVANDKINGLVTLSTYKYQGQRRVTSWTLDAAATVENDATFTPTTVTIAELNSDIDKYENMRMKVVGATVNAAMSSKKTTITQDGSSITLFDKGSNTWTLAADDNVDVEGYPCNYSSTKEICVWKLGDVTVNKSMIATTLSFDPATAEYTVEKGKETAFTAPKAVVKDADDKVVADAKVTYKSSKTDVATVGEDGAITFVGVGSTTITASYAGDNNYKAAKDATYTITYKKQETTLAWSETEVSVNIGETFTAPTLTLKAGDETLEGKTITYTSSNDDFALVGEDGTVVYDDVEGSATITATFAGDDTYTEATASYTLTVKDPNKLVATFDFMSPSKYGYGTTSGSTAFGKGAGDVLLNATLTEGDVTLTNTKVSGSGTRFYDDGLRMYDGNQHTLSVPAGYRITSVAFDGASAYKIGDATANTSWTGNAKSLVIAYTGTNKKVKGLTVTYKKVTLPSITLDENKSNDDAIIDGAEKGYCNVNVTRTLAADGGWYTLCLPFDVEDISVTPLKDAELRKYKSMNGTTMNFEETTSLKAMHAYLVKPTATIANPVFEDVKVVIESDGVTDGSDGYSFVGIYSPATLLTDGTNLFLGDKNQFYTPTTDDRILKALRGYFVVPSGTDASKMSVNIDGETTLINAINGNAARMDGKVYSLNGQCLGNSTTALPKGIYLVNGKKFIVK